MFSVIVFFFKLENALRLGRDSTVIFFGSTRIFLVQRKIIMFV